MFQNTYVVKRGKHLSFLQSYWGKHNNIAEAHTTTTATVEHPTVHVWLSLCDIGSCFFFVFVCLLQGKKKKKSRLSLSLCRFVLHQFVRVWECMILRLLLSRGVQHLKVTPIEECSILGLLLLKSAAFWGYFSWRVQHFGVTSPGECSIFGVTPPGSQVGSWWRSQRDTLAQGSICRLEEWPGSIR